MMLAYARVNKLHPPKIRRVPSGKNLVYLPVLGASFAYEEEKFFTDSISRALPSMIHSTSCTLFIRA
ncbi:hypothetical protein G6O67_006870 [Ophiocordyceps sinensis]|uniref:Uncharacterized protein n=1 Tax=Ophiocordyceps sinensis TaxID=72228 RepID=A0A8H4PNC2_9HYPO|nr:hypothetical protein G6O67_006870 [Ophiocordyceps sinensis]